MFWIRAWCVLICVSICGYAFGAGVKLVYPADEVPGDPRFHDLKEILELALKKTAPEYGPYELEPAPVVMSKARYMGELRQGGTINIVWSSTSKTLENELLPIRIPLRKGLLGYRVLLIEKGKQALFDKVRTLDDLRKFTVGQGRDWGDVAIFEQNGFTVFQSKYESLFKMLQAGRFDMFPRGLGEAFPELHKFSQDDPNLTVESGLLLYYPWPYYFFFNKRDVRLHDRVEKGLRIMLKDGSFDAIFRKYNGSAIEKANLKGRRLIRLHNPMLPADTPTSESSLWFDPGIN